jgi:formamidopyrimidine-DNA glycosylase
MGNINFKSSYIHGLPHPYNKIGDGPEGPEVTILAERLNKLLKGKTLLNIEVIGGRYLKQEIYGLKDMKYGIKVTKVDNRGKLLYLRLSNGLTIWNTLGMSGRWTLNKGKHSHVKFSFNNLVIYYTDVRRFGTLRIDNNNKLKTLKYDILKDDITFANFKMEFKKRKNKEITQLLMDPKLFTNIGNYIKCESLYLAKISPKRTTHSLTDNELKRLLKSIRYVLKSSYITQGGKYNYLPKVKGTSNFEFKVYKQKHALTYKSKDNRTTYWVKIE